ncbi:hypothetical protein NMY22_g9996 [Coprinellus aureogranulatus]|nr:hypothetical protein NMY22_g9996 [Coprinellus aureogranulatus]
MSWFKKKDKSAIPPVEQPSYNSAPPAPRYTPQTYVPSRDGGLYDSVAYQQRVGGGSQQQPNYELDQNAFGDKYARNRGIGDPYSRGGMGGGGGEADRDRSELFAGYQPKQGATAGQETEEDLEGIKTQTRFVKQESVASTRNALRLAREAEETARNTLGRLGDQSEKLANTERHLDVSKGHSLRAEDKTDELKQLNKSIFRPVITWNKDAKRAAQEAKIQARYDEERDEREKAMMDIRETQNRLGKATTYGGDDDLLGGSRRMKTAEQLNARKEQRKRFQFEATASDDELEDELDDNLDEIGDAVKRLKALGTTMGQELDSQNDRITRIEGKTVGLDNRIFRNTERGTWLRDRSDMVQLSAYELERERNIARNSELLEKLGLDKPAFEKKELARKKAPQQKKRKAEAVEAKGPERPAKASRRAGEDSPPREGPRRSSRIAGKKIGDDNELDMKGRKDGMSWGVVETKRRHDPKVFGSIPGIEVGTWWASRQGAAMMQYTRTYPRRVQVAFCFNPGLWCPYCSPPVGGISGGKDGAHSVALSGGYADDVDLGYTLCDFSVLFYAYAAKNRLVALTQAAVSSRTRKPVRVIRGFKVKSKYAPTKGYRYDGLYVVERAWMEIGLGGYEVCRYALTRLPNQPPLPVRDEEQGVTDSTEEEGADDAKEGKKNEAGEASG